MEKLLDALVGRHQREQTEGTSVGQPLLGLASLRDVALNRITYNEVGKNWHAAISDEISRVAASSTVSHELIANCSKT